MPLGILVNSGCVLLGGLIGAMIGKKFPQKLAEALPTVFGLSAMTMGISLIIKMTNLSAVVLAMIVGTVIGELLEMENGLLKLLHKIQPKSKTDVNKEHMEILISMIVLFCFSGTGIFGALNSGMTGDHSILFAKSILDFFTAIIFGAAAGYLVGLVSIPQCLVGLTLFFSAGFILPVVNDIMLSDFKACGGIITLAVGFKIAKIKHVRVLNMLPALVLVMPFSYLWGLLPF